jgi:hypothetical protein
VTDNTAGNLPPPDVQQAAAKVQSWLDRQQQAPQPQRVDAFDKFQRLERSDSPPPMPAWSRELAGNSQPQPGERAADKFKRQRLAQDEKGNFNVR